MNSEIRREIGSEFWVSEDFNNVVDIKAKSDNTAYLLSGRTALDFIIKDIKSNHEFNSVMLPSYCCESMIEPFINNGISVSFYTVIKDEILYDFNNDCDVVLLIDFFGFECNKNIEIAEKENSRKIIIYDATHKIDGNTSLNGLINYSFCSYRKWFYSNFAVAKKYFGDFSVSPSINCNQQYIDLRDRAAVLKKSYITDKNCDKKMFLDLYSQAESLLEKDYIDYSGIVCDFDLESIIKKRRENAEFLMKELSQIPQIELYRSTLSENDAPLFIPMFAETKTRDLLRKYLIENDIYCPVHWPISSLHTLSEEQKEMYVTELSLICDQRYNTDDMSRLTEIIKNFFGEKF